MNKVYSTIMNNYKQIILAAASALALTACSSNDAPTEEGPVEIALGTGLDVDQTVGTRAVAASDNLMLQETQFASTSAVAGNAVAVYVEEAGGTTTTYTPGLKYTPDGSGNLTVPTTSKQYFPSSGNDVNIYAYYPAQSTDLVPATALERSVGQIGFPVQTDQTTLAAYALSDLMYGVPDKYGTTTKANPIPRTASKVNLKFEHLLSKVTIVVKPGTAQGVTPAMLNGAVVTIGKTRTKAAFNFTTGQLVAGAEGQYYAEGSAEEEVKVMTLTGADSQEGSVILVPQTLAANAEFIKIQLAEAYGSGIYIYKPATALTLTPKMAYTYTVTVNRQDLNLTSTIVEWGRTDAVDDATAIQY